MSILLTANRRADRQTDSHTVILKHTCGSCNLIHKLCVRAANDLERLYKCKKAHMHEPLLFLI